MPFDATKPVNGSEILSAELRAQFTSLKALIDAQATLIATMQTQITQLTGDLANRPTFPRSGRFHSGPSYYKRFI